LEKRDCEICSKDVPIHNSLQISAEMNTSGNKIPTACIPFQTN